MRKGVGWTEKLIEKTPGGGQRWIDWKWEKDKGEGKHKADRDSDIKTLRGSEELTSGLENGKERKEVTTNTCFCFGWYAGTGSKVKGWQVPQGSREKGAPGSGRKYPETSEHIKACLHQYTTEPWEWEYRATEDDNKQLRDAWRHKEKLAQ